MQQFACAPKYKMGKDKESESSYLRRMVSEFPNEFRADKSVLFCLVCDIPVTASQRSQVTQHRNTGKPLQALQEKPN